MRLLSGFFRSLDWIESDSDGVENFLFDYAELNCRFNFVLLTD